MTVELGDSVIRKQPGHLAPASGQLVDYAPLVASPACFALRRELIEPWFSTRSFLLASAEPTSNHRVSGEWDSEQEEASMGRRLYVGNLPYSTGESELQELFSRAGNVESVRVMRDAATGRARGFAFVEMATDEEAQKAATEFNQYMMGGRSLTVNEARPKPEGGFGGGGGFGSNRGGGNSGRREPRW